MNARINSTQGATFFEIDHLPFLDAMEVADLVRRSGGNNRLPSIG
jgi:hypothetical protein